VTGALRAPAALRAVPPLGWVALLATAAVAVVIQLDAPPPVRVPLAIGWALIGPGLPWARLVGGLDGATSLLVAVLISVALLLVVGATLALLGVYSPAVAHVLLAAVSVAGVVVATLRRTSDPPRTTGPTATGGRTP
jgi:hypothetical protein